MSYLNTAQSVRTQPASIRPGPLQPDELVNALSVVPVSARRLLDWPAEPPWFAEWMKADDARRLATMAAGLLRWRPR